VAKQHSGSTTGSRLLLGQKRQACDLARAGLGAHRRKGVSATSRPAHPVNAGTAPRFCACSSSALRTATVSLLLPLFHRVFRP
jgi:hypothetical protein